MIATQTQKPTAVCTIISTNYLHYARTLMDSVRQAHPEWHQYVLLVDEIGGAFEPRHERFEVVDVKELSIPDPKKFFFRYNILEANTAAKPWFLAWLFNVKKLERVIYLDPDTFVYRRLEEVTALLDRSALMVLTPHLTGEISDNFAPSEQDILRCGCHNLGFLALGRHPELNAFLSWWQRKLEFACRVAKDEGLFVDQKWMDLAPGMFEGVSVLRHPGYNVGYWNLSHRKMTEKDGVRFVNGQPLVFFHFSGLDPHAPNDLSRFQNRYRLGDLAEIRGLVEQYCAHLRGNGLETMVHFPYAFGRFYDGDLIPDAVRLFYGRDARAQRLAGDDPFAADHAYLNEPWGSSHDYLITHLMRTVWETRADLQIAFPEIDGLHRQAYEDYFVARVAAEESLPERFVTPVRLRKVEREALAERLALVERRSLYGRLRRSPTLRMCRKLVHLPLGLVPADPRQRFKRNLKRWLFGKCDSLVPS